METATQEGKIIYEPVRIGTWKDEAKFVISGVSYRGQTGLSRLFEQMTPAMNQDALAELYETEKQKGNPVPTDMPLIWAIASRGYDRRNEIGDSEKLRQFLRTGLRRYPNTLTRAVYASEGNDKIIHNHKTSDEYSIEGQVVGPNGWLSEMSDKNVLESLLGTNDVTKINEVSQWINGTDSYIWRVNSKPKEKIEKVAGLDAGGSRLGFDCYRVPQYECPAFRVLKVD